MGISRSVTLNAALEHQCFSADSVKKNRLEEIKAGIAVGKFQNKLADRLNLMRYAGNQPSQAGAAAVAASTAGGGANSNQNPAGGKSAAAMLKSNNSVTKVSDCEWLV